MLRRPECDEAEPMFQANHAPTDTDERRALAYAQSRLEFETCRDLGYEWRPTAAGTALGYDCRPDLGSSCPPAGECVVPDARVHDPTWCAANRDPPVYGCRRRRVQCATSRPGRKTYSPGQRGDDPTTGTCYACPSSLYAQCKPGYKQGDDEACGFMGMGCRAVCEPEDATVGDCDLCYFEVFDGEPRPDALHAQLIYPRGQDRRVCATATGGLPEGSRGRPLCLTDDQCAAYPGTTCQGLVDVVAADDVDLVADDENGARSLTGRSLWGAFPSTPDGNYGLVDSGVVVATPDGKRVGQACGTLSGPCFAGDNRFLDARALDNAARGLTAAQRKAGRDFGPQEQQGRAGALCWGDGDHLDPGTYTLPADMGPDVSCDVATGRCRNLLGQGPDKCTSDDDCRCLAGQIRLRAGGATTAATECAPVAGVAQPLTRPTRDTVPHARTEGNTNALACHVAGSGGYPAYGVCQLSAEPYGAGHSDPCLNDGECADGSCHLGVCRSPPGVAGAGSLKTCHLASNGLTADQRQQLLQGKVTSVQVASRDGKTTARVGRADLCDAGILRDATTCDLGALQEVCVPRAGLLHVDDHDDAAAPQEARRAADVLAADGWAGLDDGSANWGVHATTCAQTDRSRASFRTDYFFDPEKQACEARLTASRRWCEMPWTRVDPSKTADLPPAGESTWERMHANSTASMHVPFHYDPDSGACSITRSYCENAVTDGGYATEYGAVLGDAYACGSVPKNLEVATGGDCCSPPDMKAVEFLFGKTAPAFVKTEAATASECLACLASDDGTAPGGEPCDTVCGQISKAAGAAAAGAYFLSDRRLKRRLRRVADDAFGPGRHRYAWKWTRAARRLYPTLRRGWHEGPLAQEQPSHLLRRDRHGHLWVRDERRPSQATCG